MNDRNTIDKSFSFSAQPSSEVSYYGQCRTNRILVGITDIGHLSSTITVPSNIFDLVIKVSRMFGKGIILIAHVSHDQWRIKNALWTRVPRWIPQCTIHLMDLHGNENIHTIILLSSDFSLQFIIIHHFFTYDLLHVF